MAKKVIRRKKPAAKKPTTKKKTATKKPRTVKPAPKRGSAKKADVKKAVQEAVATEEKLVGLTVRIDRDVRDKFVGLIRTQGKTARDVVGAFVEQYVKSGGNA